MDLLFQVATLIATNIWWLESNDENISIFVFLVVFDALSQVYDHCPWDKERNFNSFARAVLVSGICAKPKMNFLTPVLLDIIVICFSPLDTATLFWHHKTNVYMQIID